MSKPASRPTIITVAAAAEVSVATVSRVVRGHPDVSPETRDRVQRVIEEVGFRPSPLARALVSGTSRTLGLLVGDITNPFYPELAKRVEQAAADAGYVVVICNTMEDRETTRQAVQRLLDLRVGGLIHSSVGLDEPDVEALVGSDPPVVYVNRQPQNPRASFVVSDNDRAGSIVAEHLLEKGHRRIGLLAGPSFSSVSRARERGFLAAMEAHPEPTRPLVEATDFSSRMVRDIVTAWLAADDPPTAIVGVNDMVAIRALELLLESGRRVPEDVAVAGFDDIELARLKLIDLTSVAQDTDYLARESVRLVLRMIGGRRPRTLRALQKVAAPELKARGTTAAPPSR